MLKRMLSSQSGLRHNQQLLEVRAVSVQCSKFSVGLGEGATPAVRFMLLES